MWISHIANKNRTIFTRTKLHIIHQQFTRFTRKQKQPKLKKKKLSKAHGNERCMIHCPHVCQTLQSQKSCTPNWGKEFDMAKISGRS